MRKIAVRLSLSTFSSLEYYMNMQIEDMLEIAEEIQEVIPKNG